MKKYIIVTGGAGFVGSNLIEYLKDKTNLKIISLDNYLSGKKRNHIKNKNIRYIKGDTNDFYKIFLKYKKEISVIFHFGEYSRIHQSFFETKKCFDSNISGTSKVLSFCLENKVRIIYSATSASLGNNGLDQSLSPYAYTKSKNIKLIMHLNKWFNLKYEALYFYNVYGPKQIKKGHNATVIGIFENQLENNLAISVVKPGTQTRKFTHINDTVKGCYYAWKKKKNRHYSLSNSKSYTILQVAKLFNKKIKFLKPRLGERNKSSTVTRLGKIKIYPIPCKLSLKSYIEDFRNKLGM